jgi:hypothetical protein
VENKNLLNLINKNGPVFGLMIIYINLVLTIIIKIIAMVILLGQIDLLEAVWKALLILLNTLIYTQQALFNVTLLVQHVEYN